MNNSTYINPTTTTAIHLIIFTQQSAFIYLFIGTAEDSRAIPTLVSCALRKRTTTNRIAVLIGFAEYSIRHIVQLIC